MLEYKKRFNYYLNEDMMASTAFSGGNSVGQTGGSFGNVDSYAPNDARKPHALGTIDLTNRDKKKKTKKDKEKEKKLRKKEREAPGPGIPVMQTRETGMNGPSNSMSYGLM